VAAKTPLREDGAVPDPRLSFALERAVEAF
jgi:hypothetical protein